MVVQHLSVFILKISLEHLIEEIIINNAMEKKRK